MSPREKGERYRGLCVHTCAHCPSIDLICHYLLFMDLVLNAGLRKCRVVYCIDLLELGTCNSPFVWILDTHSLSCLSPRGLLS